MHPLTPPVSITSLTSTVPVFDHLELSGYNLATHTSTFGQQRKSTHLVDNSLAILPSTVCGKRSRANSSASSFDSSSDASSYNSSVFSSQSSYDSPTSVEQTTPSRKSSIGQEGEQQLNNLAAWRASVLSEQQAERCTKRAKAAHVDAVVEQRVPAVTAVAQPASAAASVPVPNHAVSPAASASPECKNTFVDCLVDTACQTLDRIWKASTSSSACDLGEVKTGLPLQVFVRETLRRGRATCSVLQAALLYCARLGEAMQQRQCPLVGPVSDMSAISAKFGLAKEDVYFLRCPRRMFLASILISSKFLQDRTYSNRAWAKLSGLNVKDLGRIERAFLKAIDYRLVVSDGQWNEWNAELKRARTSGACNDAPALSNGFHRSQSDNVTGTAAPYDTELRAASPRVASQVAHKYRPVTSQTPRQGELDSTAQRSEMSLPFPLAARTLSV